MCQFRLTCISIEIHTSVHTNTMLIIGYRRLYIYCTYIYAYRYSSRIRDKISIVAASARGARRLILFVPVGGVSRYHSGPLAEVPTNETRILTRMSLRALLQLPAARGGRSCLRSEGDVLRTLLYLQVPSFLKWERRLNIEILKFNLEPPKKNLPG